MRGAVEIRAGRDAAGRTVLSRLASGPPLTARATIDGVTLVASAGGPLGGDVIEVRVHVAAGACLVVGSAAAMVVQPGPAGGRAEIDVRMSVGAGGRLVWAPEPTVVADGGHLVSRTRVRLAPGAELTLREVVVLGRHGERGGTVESSVHVVESWVGAVEPSVDAIESSVQAPESGAGGVQDAGEQWERPLLRQENLWNDPSVPSWGPAVLAGHRVVGSVLVVDPGPLRAAVSATRPSGATVRAVMRLAPHAVLMTALGASVVDVSEALSGAGAGLASP